MKKLFTDSVILDVDGTLWDSTYLVAGAWTRAVRECGFTERTVTAEELKKLFGKPMNQIADELLPDLTQHDRNRVMELCCTYEEEVLKDNTSDICYPLVRETIRELAAEMPVCIVSNCQSGYIELFLEKSGLEASVTDFECYGNTGKYKADNLRLLIQRNHFRCPVYVGDTKGDQSACTEVGVPFIHAAYGFGSVTEPAASISSFSDLKNVVSFSVSK